MTASTDQMNDERRVKLARVLRCDGDPSMPTYNLGDDPYVCREELLKFADILPPAIQLTICLPPEPGQRQVEIEFDEEDYYVHLDNGYTYVEFFDALEKDLMILAPDPEEGAVLVGITLEPQD